ncbi:MAG: CdvA-like protein [Candidatus Bathyarchaeota archaeon]|nr:MAG: CdvA-like protein [Candidatus Bathyarchaeota archaeon]
MISWKYSLEKINGELELAKKKKEALDNLLNRGKVSQLTYDSITQEIGEAIAEIEAKQDALVEKMRVKINELEQQMKTLEHLLVNSEIRHISGEIEDDAYNRECNVLSLGLETTKHELDEIKEAISNLSEKDIDLPPPSPTPPPLQTEEETAQLEPDTEKRLEIVMDTETTTSIETTVEEQPTIEEEVEVPVEQSVESEDYPEVPVEEVEESFRSEETPFSQEVEQPETAEEIEETQTETSQETSIEEETTKTEEQE